MLFDVDGAACFCRDDKQVWYANAAAQWNGCWRQWKRNRVSFFLFSFGSFSLSFSLSLSLSLSLSPSVYRQEIISPNRILLQCSYGFSRGGLPSQYSLSLLFLFTFFFLYYLSFLPFLLSLSSTRMDITARIFHRIGWGFGCCFLQCCSLVSATAWTVAISSMIFQGISQENGSHRGCRDTAIVGKDVGITIGRDASGVWVAMSFHLTNLGGCGRSTVRVEQGSRHRRV